MKTLELKNKYNLEDIVYHRVSQEKGIVVCVRIVVDSTNKPVYEYLVSVEIGKALWMDEIELTDSII